MTSSYKYHTQLAAGGAKGEMSRNDSGIGDPPKIMNEEEVLLSKMPPNSPKFRVSNYFSK